MTPECILCKKKPGQIPEYIEAAYEEDMSPEDFIISFEGTYNRTNGHFTCTDCYIKLGSPSSGKGWVAP